MTVTALWHRSSHSFFFFFFRGRHNRYIDKRYRKQGKGKFSQGKGGTKTCDDSSIGSCVRASVTEARVTVYVCVHMPRECVCERKDVHAYCSKMLAAQQKQDYALAELWGGGGGTLQGGESKVSRKVAVQLRLQNGEPKASSLLHGGNGWSPEGSTARAAS